MFIFELDHNFDVFFILEELEDNHKNEVNLMNAASKMKRTSKSKTTLKIQNAKISQYSHSYWMCLYTKFMTSFVTDQNYTG